jgi:hypothetical protein
MKRELSRSLVLSDERVGLCDELGLRFREFNNGEALLF